MKKALIDFIKRGENDEIFTPAYAVKPLLKYLPKDKVYWECTDFGNSEITRVLKESGRTVIATGKQKFDFLKDEPYFDFDIIITNPPYSLKNVFLKRCYELGKPFALLLPITALEGVERGKLFRKYGIQVLVLDRRIEFLQLQDNERGVWFNASWFCWKLLPRDLIFEELEKDRKIKKQKKKWE